MNDIERQMWKGGREPTSFPHLCPYRQGGADKEACVELSGGNYHQNVNGCCGASRGMVRFAPCNSVARRCIVCLEIGRRGPKANSVTDVATGRCDEHTHGIQPKSSPAQLRPVHAVSIASTEGRVPPPELLIEKPKKAPQPLRVEKKAVTVPNFIPIAEKLPEKEVTFEKKRRGSATKMTALEEAAAELRKEKFESQPEDIVPKLDEQDFQLEVHELVARAAKKLRMTDTGLSSHFYKSVPQETKARWLYGKLGRKRTRSELKFAILMQVREQFRKKNDPAPRKKELAEAAARPLGMKLDSTRTYIYDRLTPEEIKALELRTQFLSLPEQIEVLKKTRGEMKKKGLPAPRRTDLAKAAAPLLRQKVDSVRTLIGRLNKEVKKELEFSGSRSSMLAGVDTAVIREGFMGAIAVLRLRKLRLTVDNLQIVLRLKPAVIESYLSENPDIKALLVNDKS